MRAVVVLGMVMVATANVRAESVTIGALKENTLYHNTLGAVSNGAGMHFFAGRNSSGAVRRGVIAFDVAGHIPAGSTVTGATLQLTMSRTVAGTQSVSLHRVLASWGEGASTATSVNEGGGGPSDAGDATWVHRAYPALMWTNAGGDFAVVASATASIAGDNNDLGQAYQWTSAELAADVQAWVDDPESNDGWLLKGNEAAARTTKRFDSHEFLDINLPDQGASRRPKLIVTFTPPPPSCAGDTNGDGAADGADLSVLLGQFGQAVAPGTGGDLNDDGLVNAADLSVLLADFGCV